MCFARGDCKRMVWNGSRLKLTLQPDGDPGFWWPLGTKPVRLKVPRGSFAVAPDLLAIAGSPVVVHFDGDLVEAVSRLVEERREADERERHLAAMRLILEREVAVLGFVPSC